MAPGPIRSGAFTLRRHPHLYEINTWAWLEEISARSGRLVTLGDVGDTEWDSLAAKGFDAVWLMGVWRRSPAARLLALAHAQSSPEQFDRVLPGWKPDDIVASPYAVAEYVPDARIGAWQSLDKTRDKLHQRGMALFLDFVGNHTAIDHPWTREHPEFYVQGTQQDFERDPESFFLVESAKGAVFIAHGKDPYFPPWRDTAQLNHFEAGMRAAQLEGLRTIARHCDGVRCDMAMLHLRDIFGTMWAHLLGSTSAPRTEFWSDAHVAVPELTLLAEAYWGTESRLLDLGFSFAYDKGLYDSIRDICMPNIHSILAANADDQSRRARFLENHDEPRCASVFGAERLRSVAILMGTLPGMRFYHQGELEGRKEHLPITLRIAAPQPPDGAIAPVFEQILSVTKQDVFHAGEWTLLAVTHDNEPTSGNLIAFEWRLGNLWKLIVVNLAAIPSQGRVQLGDRASPEKTYTLRDELDGTLYSREGTELRAPGLFVRRDPFTAHLFDVTTAN